mgnify:CR=1 FL=1
MWLCRMADHYPFKLSLKSDKAFLTHKFFIRKRSVTSYMRIPLANPNNLCYSMLESSKPKENLLDPQPSILFHVFLKWFIVDSKTKLGIAYNIRKDAIRSCTTIEYSKEKALEECWTVPKLSPYKGGERVSFGSALMDLFETRKPSPSKQTIILQVPRMCRHSSDHHITGNHDSWRLLFQYICYHIKKKIINWKTIKNKSRHTK